MIRWAVLAASLLVCTSSPADTEQVQRWLDRMSYAVNNLTYTGTLVLVRGDQLDTFKIWHRADDDEKLERLMALSGSPREVWRDRESVRCIFPEAQQVLVDSRLAEGIFPSFAAEQLDSEHYTFNLGPVEYMSGMRARVIDIRPRDKFRYGHRLWLDEESGMLLKSQLSDGQIPVEQLMFTDVVIGGTIADNELRPPPRPGYVEVEIPQSVQASVSGEAPAHWAVKDVPRGFKLRSHRHTNLGEQRSEHLLFSDGMASVSVYVERRRGGGLSGHSRVGAVSMFGINKNGYNVTAVGEVPSSTVRKMATSITPRDR